MTLVTNLMLKLMIEIFKIRLKLIYKQLIMQYWNSLLYSNTSIIRNIVQILVDDCSELVQDLLSHIKDKLQFETSFSKDNNICKVINDVFDNINASSTMFCFLFLGFCFLFFRFLYSCRTESRNTSCTICFFWITEEKCCFT